MRKKIDYQETFNYNPSNSVKIVREYVNKYKMMDLILQENPTIFDLAHADFEKWLSRSKKGREADYTTDQIVRCVLILFFEKWSYRQTVVNVDSNLVLQQFARLEMLPMMDFTFLNKAYCAIQEATWEKINQVLNRYALQKKKISGKKLRLDSTVYESDIHYPTDSSLLWDSFRTLARLLKKLKEDMKAVGLRHRFHTKKVKKLNYFISRNGKSTSKKTQRKVKSTYRTLIDRVRWIAEVTRETVQRLAGTLCGMMGGTVDLKHYLPIVERIIHQAEMRVFQGVILPAEEKVYSLFEEHTELLKRGKAGKPIEFGHKILVVQSGEKYITHYQVLRRRKEDKDLLDDTLVAHKTLFGKAPEVLAGDRGFYQDRKQLKKLGKEIKTVSISVKGNRTPEEKAWESSDEFKEGQRFRAGSEGSISVLKRAFKLKRCLFKGYKNYAVSVGCAVFCHNLALLARL
jgi:transposase, IS5 family